MPLIRTGAVSTGVLKTSRFGELAALHERRAVSAALSMIVSCAPGGTGRKVSAADAGAPRPARLSVAGAAAGSGHSGYGVGYGVPQTS